MNFKIKSLLFALFLTAIASPLSAQTSAQPEDIVLPTQDESSANDPSVPSLTEIAPKAIESPLSAQTSAQTEDTVLPAPNDSSVTEDIALPTQNDSSVPPLSDIAAESPPATDDQWHFKFQPFATIPLNTYGSATVRGRTVDYHLGLGSLLQLLTVTASGRVEAWNGNLGFIIEGYFANLNAIKGLQKSEFPNVNSLSAINYILSSDLNARLQGVTDSIQQQLTPLSQVEGLKNSEQLANLKVNVQDLKSQVADDAQRILAAKTKLEDFQNLVDNNPGALQNLVFKFDNFKDSIATSISDLRDLSLTVGEVKNETLQIWQNLENGNIDPNLERGNIKAFIAKNIDTIRNINGSDPFGDVRDKAQDIQEKVQTARALGQQIEQKVEEIRSVRDIGQLKTKLTQTRDLIQATQQKIETLRTIKDSEELANLQNKLQTLQTILNKELGVIEEIKNYATNPNNRDLTINTTSDLSFSQGIYDFAVSYHFGDPASYALPKEPSNRDFPLVWFEPIAGARLNDINVNLNQIVNVQYASSLINFQGSYQQNFSQGRTWFEPMIGGKFGVQFSDRLTFILRGDVSGFDLVADSNWSWNALAAVDWWVNPNTSLQLGYRFYQIKLYNGTGENAFGFSESFNGPMLSATFNF